MGKKQLAEEYYLKSLKIFEKVKEMILKGDIREY